MSRDCARAKKSRKIAIRVKELQRTVWVEYCPGNSDALASNYTRFREGTTTRGPNVPLSVTSSPLIEDAVSLVMLSGL